MLDSVEPLAVRVIGLNRPCSLLELKRPPVMMLFGFRRSPSYLVMRLIVNVQMQMQDLPILLHVDRAVVIIVVLVVVVRLVTSVVERRPVHVGVTSTRGGLLP